MVSIAAAVQAARVPLVSAAVARWGGTVSSLVLFGTAPGDLGTLTLGGTALATLGINPQAYTTPRDDTAVAYGGGRAAAGDQMTINGRSFAIGGSGTLADVVAAVTTPNLPGVRADITASGRLVLTAWLVQQPAGLVLAQPNGSTTLQKLGLNAGAFLPATPPKAFATALGEIGVPACRMTDAITIAATDLAGNAYGPVLATLNGGRGTGSVADVAASIQAAVQAAGWASTAAATLTTAPAVVTAFARGGGAQGLVVRNTAGGTLTLGNGAGTPLDTLGLAAGTYQPGGYSAGSQTVFLAAPDAVAPQGRGLFIGGRYRARPHRVAARPGRVPRQFLARHPDRPRELRRRQRPVAGGRPVDRLGHRRRHHVGDRERHHHQRAGGAAGTEPHRAADQSCGPAARFGVEQWRRALDRLTTPTGRATQRRFHHERPCMNRIVTAAAVASLLLGADAAAQSLPSPQFTTPPANDNSNAAATTAWVRALGLSGGGGGGGGSGGNVTTSTVLVPGSSVARSLGAREGTVFNILDYGAKADGTTDIAPALNAIAALLGAGSANVVYLPAGNYALKSAVTFTGVAPILQGQGFTAGPAPASGTMITISGTGYVPFTFQGVNARGAVVRDLAVREMQPATGPGWQPTGYDYVFKVLNALGEVSFDNVLFAGVTRGIYADNSGRLDIRDVSGQFYTAGIEIDDCYDIPRIQHLHAWTYQSADASVVSWQEANQDTLILRRVDGIFIGDLFSLGARSAIHLTSGANGVTTKFYISNLYADFVRYGVWIDGAGTTGQIANATTQHNDQTAPATRLPGSKGLLVNATGVTVQIDNWRTDLVETSAIDVEQSGNRVDIGQLWVNGYNSLNNGAAAINVADSGTNPINTLNVAGQPLAQNGNGGPLVNTGNGASARSVLMNLPGGAANEPRLYASAAGNPVSGSAIGPDANIDFYLGAKGPTGSLRLRAQNGTVLRLDSPGPGDTDLLLRSGTGAASFITESASANADISLGAKGSGSVRLQSGGATVLRTTSPGATDTDALFTAGSGSVTLAPENAAGAADLILAGQGATNGVRVMANGGLVLRADNPAAGNSDVLVRAGTNSVSLITESGVANADLALAAKNAGSVRLLAGGGAVLRATNAGGGDTDALVTSSAGAVGIAPENTAGLADLLLAGTGTTGGVRLQAAGTTVLRADNVSAGNADLLVRSGTDTVALTVETPDPNANLVLNPKGTGTVVVPTPPTTDNSTNAASTAFVKAVVAGATAGVSSFDTRTGAVTLTTSDITAALGFTPYSAANPGAYITASGAPVQSIAGRTGAVALAVADVSGAAPLASPALTGTPTAPTQATGDNTAAIATDAFVKAQGYLTAAPVTTVAGRTGAVTLAVADVTGAAPTASPTLTGVTRIKALSDSGTQLQGNPPGGGGIANSNTYLLIGSTTSTTTTRLTVDGNPPAGNNCVNPASNTALNMFIEVVGIDTTTAGNVSRYRLLDGMLYKGSNNASTQFVNGVAGAAPNGSIGSGSAAAFTTAADPTNGCLALSVTAPNADTWHWAARVRSTEVQ